MNPGDPFNLAVTDLLRDWIKAWDCGLDGRNVYQRTLDLLHGKLENSEALLKRIDPLKKAAYMKERFCECGEKLVGHEDESSTKCRWCITGWKPSSHDDLGAETTETS